MKVAITDADINDAEAIAHIHKIGWLHTYPNVAFKITHKDIQERVDAKLSIEKWREVIKQPHTKTFVASFGTEIVGFCFAKKEEGLGRIGSIYILPKFQSKGIGQKLISAATAYLGRGNPIALEVATYNKKAILFYQKLGFIESGKQILPEQTVVFKSGVVLPEIEMVLLPL